MNKQYLSECEARRKSVERALAVILTATNGPNKSFMDALDDYIFGKISLRQLENGVDNIDYIGD